MTPPQLFHQRNSAVKTCFQLKAAAVHFYPRHFFGMNVRLNSMLVSVASANLPIVNNHLPGAGC